MTRRALLAAVSILGVAQASKAGTKWSSFGFGRRAAPAVGRCYKICPPVVYPWGHDPYYDSPYYIHEQELHGGPYGVGTMNPYGGNVSPVGGDASHPVAGHWPGIRRPVIPMQAPTATPESSPYPMLVPSNQSPFSGPDTVSNRDLMFDKRAILMRGGNPDDFGPLNQAFLEQASVVAPHIVRRSAYRAMPDQADWAKHSGVPTTAAAAAAAAAAPAAAAATTTSTSHQTDSASSSFATQRARISSASEASLLEVGAAATAAAPARKHFSPPCYHVCPTQDVPNPDDEPNGGPFGPEPHSSPQAKRIFSRQGALPGHGPFYNPMHEPYGGPYGPDPYFEYGSQGMNRGSGQGNPAPGFSPIMARP